MNLADVIFSGAFANETRHVRPVVEKSSRKLFDHNGFEDTPCGRLITDSALTKVGL